MTTTDVDDVSLSTLSRAVATHLGPEWTLDLTTLGEPDRPIGLHGPDGARLLIGFDNWSRPQRAEIWGTYPDRIGLDYRLPRHEITCSRGRGAQVIAREITRRLLPEYLVDLSTAHDIAARRARQKQARADTAGRIAAVLPGAHLSEDDSRGSLSREIRLNLPGEAWGDVHLDLDGQAADVKLHNVPADALVHLVAALSAAPAEPVASNPGLTSNSK